MRIRFPALSFELGDKIVSIQSCALWKQDVTTFGNPLTRVAVPATFGFSKPNPNPPKEIANRMFNYLALFETTDYAF